MSDLHTRLTAAITARLDVARAATPGPWSHDSGGEDMNPDVCTSDGRRLVDVLLGDHDTRDWYPQAMADAEHIASWDPSTAIRVLEALQEVVERHAPEHLGFDQPLCMWCRNQHGENEWWPCADVLSVAAALGVEVE